MLRHELKYHINQGDAALLSSILRGSMHRDANADEKGLYHIRSLYFDDASDSAYVDKLNGVRDRDKYRIRIYNLTDAQIRLERKTKRGDYIEKTAVMITRKLAEKIIAGDPSGLETIDHPLLHDVYIQMRTRLLRPAVIVDYEREAYVHPAENTRITLDRQLHSGLFSHDLFNPRLPTIPALRDDTVVLEVKYDRRIPSYLPPLLASIRASRSAISKYVLCRQFEYSS